MRTSDQPKLGNTSERKSGGCGTEHSASEKNAAQSSVHYHQEHPAVGRRQSRGEIGRRLKVGETWRKKFSRRRQKPRSQGQIGEGVIRPKSGVRE